MTESIKITNVVEQIYELHELYNSIENDDKRLVMCRMFMKHMESFIDKMEESYFKKIIQKKPITQLKNYQEIQIQQTYNTMNVFLPFMIAYNINR
jgi:uncharacterized protein Yka (UPF0111/DUF47 family)